MSLIAKKHSHYHKPVGGLASIDVYRVIALFNVTDPCLQHAIKKLLVAGGRGAGKDATKDVQEVIDSCTRYLEMRHEDIDMHAHATGVVTSTGSVIPASPSAPPKYTDGFPPNRRSHDSTTAK